jgi:hypothetical protein
MNAVAKLESAIISRVPAEEYYSMPGISITRLKTIGRSPLHYQYELANPKQSAAMTLGTAAHCAVLEPHLYESRFAVWSRVSDGGNACPRKGQYWDAFVLESKGKTILTADEHRLAQAIGNAVRSDPTAMKYLAFGEPEVTMQHGDRRGRADWITKLEGRPFVVGLKTARDCRPFVFGSAAAKLGYPLQWAWYFDLYESITGVEPEMVEIVVESAPPHAVVTYIIPEDVILQGRDEYEKLLEVLYRCERTGEWPGPAECEQVLSLPSWYYGDGTDDLTDIGLEIGE